ncbi:MMPL family transporter [Nocardioides sp.]|uniref:MMPL family transporter n=1 Tax=Nocardioides sp. TaxID=35761 RepID=UPI0026238D6A|nr:MMPL family transporter [Nocardioides sp.]MDI6912552.1 MMPL family transporter [Nocardioides sp.]
MALGVRIGTRQPLKSALEVGHRFPALVVLGWVVAAAALSLLVTPLGTVVERSSTAFLPEDSPTLQGLRVMDSAFGSGNTQSYVFVVVTNDNGLSAEDRRVYADVVHVLGGEPERVSEVQGYLGKPEARRSLTSKDGEATYLVVGLRSAVGSPASDKDVQWLRSVVDDLNAPPGTDVHVTGDPAMIADLTTAVNDASLKITAVSLVLLIGILWLVYRRVTTVLVSLTTIGIALLCTRGALAWAGEHGLALSTYTDAFVVAITLGAGTDYCVFLISRFREEYGNGLAPLDAVAESISRVGPALLASAATVILGAICLGFTDLAIFATTGPPMAICIGVTVAVSLTFTPALMRWFGPRIGPAPPSRADSRWARTGRLVARHPARILVAGVTVLVLLALGLPTMQLSFDERAAQPPDTPSNLGLAAMADHFPPNQTLPDYLLIRSDHDMANTRDLAVLNSVSIALAKVDGVDQVLSITQPAGQPLRPASIANQLGELASGLRMADRKLESGEPGLQRLASGAGDLGGGLDKVSIGAGKAQDGARKLSNGSRRIGDGLGKATDRTGQAADGARQLRDGARRLRDGAAGLAAGLRTAHDQVAEAVEGLGMIVEALEGDPICTADPVCNRSREGLRKIYSGQRDQLLPGLARAAAGAEKLASGDGRLATGLDQVADGLDQLAAGLRRAQSGSNRVAAGQALLSEKLGELESGTGRLATGADGIAPGIEQLLTQTEKLRDGLDDSGDYLQDVNQRADTPEAGGFYLPASALGKPDFALARSQFLSEDGKLARIQVTGDTDPLTPAGQQRYDEVQAAAEQAMNNTRLDDSTILATGAGGLGADLAHYLADDAVLVVVAVLLMVLLILVLTLRALAAPLYLLASVVLSCAAALGLTTLVFQHLGGQDIHFTVPVIVFVLLVAVGADYNILLMSRMRENGLALDRNEVARAVTATGPVITAAGLIFASTFVALLFSPVEALAQTGFAVAAGLLLDTFIVRTLVVPACAAQFEEHSWWPHRNPTTKGARP